MALILDGKKLSNLIRDELKEEAQKLYKLVGRKPKLAVVLVGRDEASRIYVKNKQKACQQVGIDSELILKPSDIPQSELEEIVMKLNEDGSVDGILVQLPLPKHIDPKAVINLIRPEKDVDGFTPPNMGKVVLNLYDSGLMPCTPYGVMWMLKHYGVEVKGKNAVVIGHSNIVGKPLANFLLNEDATVSVCHVYTKDIRDFTKDADIVFSATGVPHLIKEDMVKEGVVVVDIGISRLNGKIVGDVDFERVKKKASAITPVPGGVGPMTITVLMYNTLKAFKMREKID